MAPSSLAPVVAACSSSSRDSLASASRAVLQFYRGPVCAGRDGSPLLPPEPRRGTQGSAGLDLFVAEEEVLRPGETCILDSHFG